MIFKTLFRGSAKKPAAPPQTKLPALHQFVEVAVGGRSMRSASVEDVDAEKILLAGALGRAGERAVFVYQNEYGKFRFVAPILEVHEGKTAFELPARIEALAGGPVQKRSSVRLDTLLTGSWRLAPGGRGTGEFVKGSIRDISRGGCALIADRQCKAGETLEVRMNLKNDGPPLALLGEVVRCEQIPTSGKFSHGLRFQGLTAEEDRLIREFIQRRQAELRSRGLA